MLPTAQVHEVTVKSRGGGAIQGAPIGAGLVGALSYSLPVPASDCAADELFGKVCAGTRKAFAVGAIFGAIIGAIRSSRDKVEVIPSNSPTAGIQIRPTLTTGVGLTASISFGSTQ